MQAILLAGGRGQRLGGVNKALLRRAAESGAESPTLLSLWCAALDARGIGGVVVGAEELAPQVPRARFALTQEDPPFSGPAAAVCAGVRALEGSAQQVLLGAVDVVDPGPLLDWLLSLDLRQPEWHGVLPHDQQGRPQWLASVISREWLQHRAAQIACGAERGQSMRWLLGPASLRPVTMPPGLGEDIDEPAQARRLGIQL
ncbi:molybdenum cofactor guanylyltransferase [Nesterenkonia sp.]|uniref:molybdenum cofactor guanylyltransferase n=1 Tax=Nesterenkonia sp. TaxID=704201 RepID=UPI0026371CCB|nr:nucleotidyltransferase family protein [Nesterenkonia sp.]